MVTITFIDSEGTTRPVEAEEGSTVMENAIRNAVPEIEAECGGACACATCHCYVDEAWREPTGSASAMEESMLDFAEAETRRRGLPEIRLYTNEKMERNIALYAARGYAETGRQESAGFRRVFMAKRAG